jgi:hypothetical protein
VEQGQGTKTKVVERRQQEAATAVSVEPVADVLTWVDYPLASVAAATSASSVDAQAARVGNVRVHCPQRHAMLRRIGRLQGNRHVQRVVASLNDRHGAIQRNVAEEAPSDPVQLMNQVGMLAEEGSFAQWFAGHWRTAMGLNPQRFIVGAGGAWTWGGGTTEYTFRPNARQPTIPSDWFEEMQDLYCVGEEFSTDDAAIFATNRDGLQATIDYWAAGFDERVRSAAGEGAYGFVQNQEYRRFLSVMGLWPPEVTVPSYMNGSRYYQPRPPTRAGGQAQSGAPVQRAIDLRQKAGGETTRGLRPNASTVQLAIPNIQEPAAPGIASLSGPARQSIVRLIEAYRGDRTRANGQAVVDALVGHLDPGTVQYRNQQDITNGSPLFRENPSSQANAAATASQGHSLTQGEGGFAFMFQQGPPPIYQVEIYPQAFLPGASPEEQLSHIAGIIVHEFIHVQQFRRAESGQAGRGEQFSQAHIEFQAWLWQGEHASDLGIAPGTPPFNQIITNLGTYYGQLPDPDKRRYRGRFAAVMYEAAFHQCNLFVGMNLPPSTDSIERLDRYFGWLSQTARRQNRQRHQDLHTRIEQAAAQQSGQ